MEDIILDCENEGELTDLLNTQINVKEFIKDNVEVIYNKIVENNYSHICHLFEKDFEGIGEYIKQNIENNEFIEHSLNNNDKIYLIYLCIIYHAMEINRYDICQKIIDKNLFNQYMFSIMVYCQNIYKFMNTDIIKLIENTEKLTTYAKLTGLFRFLYYYDTRTNEDLTELKNYIKDNFNLEKHLNFLLHNDIIYEYYEVIEVNLKLISETVNINCEIMDEYILKNITLICNGYRDLIDVGYDFIRLKDKYLEILCNRPLEYKCFDLFKLLVDNDAKLNYRERNTRKSDSKKVLNYLIKNNIFIPITPP